MQLFFGAPPRTETLLESSRLAEFECAISPGYNLRQKKLWLSIIPARRLSEQPGLGPPQKGVNDDFTLPQFDKLYVVGKLSVLEAEICSFSMIGEKIKNYSCVNFFALKLVKYRSTELYDVPLEESTIFL